MNEILEEYGEAILGVIAAILIIGICYYLFSEGSTIDQLFSIIANNSI